MMKFFNKPHLYKSSSFVDKPSNILMFDILEAWLKKKGNLTCELCGHKKWVTDAQETFIKPEYVPNSCYPAMVITCMNCANIKLINTAIWGLFDFDADEEIRKHEKAKGAIKCPTP